MTHSAWITLSHLVTYGDIGVAIVIFGATCVISGPKRSNPLGSACTAIIFTCIGSWLVWQSWPIFILGESARHIGDPAYVPSTWSAARLIDPTFRPWWASHPSWFLITTTTADLLSCLVIILWVYARARDRMHDAADAVPANVVPSA